MQFHERGSNPNHDIAIGKNSISVGAAPNGPTLAHISHGTVRIAHRARAEGNRAGAFRSMLASQKFEDFLAGFFAVLAIVYFVAATTFAGVLIGNAFGS